MLNTVPKSAAQEKIVLPPYNLLKEHKISNNGTIPQMVGPLYHV